MMFRLIFSLGATFGCFRTIWAAEEGRLKPGPALSSCSRDQLAAATEVSINRLRLLRMEANLLTQFLKCAHGIVCNSMLNLGRS